MVQNFCWKFLCGRRRSSRARSKWLKMYRGTQGVRPASITHRHRPADPSNMRRKEGSRDNERGREAETERGCHESINYFLHGAHGTVLESFLAGILSNRKLRFISSFSGYLFNAHSSWKDSDFFLRFLQGERPWRLVGHPICVFNFVQLPM